MKYIIRFKEKNEIITLKFEDKTSSDYMVQKLENEKIDYIIIKVKEIKTTHDKWELNNLLDCEHIL